MPVQILVVDDNAIQGATRKVILSGAGWNTTVTQSPAEALLLLKRADFLAGLRVLITDHVMPQISGPELVAKVREMLPTLPILVISGDPEASGAYQGMDVSFELKPVHPELLIRTVQTLGGFGGVLRTA